MLAYTGWFINIVGVSVACNLRTRNNKLKLRMEFVSLAGNFLFGNLCSSQWCPGENRTSYFKMVTVQEKEMYLRWFFETRSVIKPQCRYRAQCGKDPPSDNVIKCWSKQFQENSCVLYRKRAERPTSSQENIDRIQKVLYRNPQSQLDNPYS